MEIARAYSFKLNIGNYQGIDVFCSAKKEAEEKDAEKVADDLYKFCRDNVAKEIKELKKVFKSEVSEAVQSVIDNPTPTVEQWETMPPVEQALRQQLKLAGKRIEYAQNKNA